MNYKDFDNLDDDKKLEMINKLLDRVNDKPLKLMRVAWNRMNITMGERMIIEKMLNEFDYETVRDAFTESCGVESQKRTLNYVRAIARQLFTKKSAEKNEIEGNKFKADLNKKNVLGGEWEGKDSPLTELKQKYNWR